MGAWSGGRRWPSRTGQPNFTQLYNGAGCAPGGWQVAKDMNSRRHQVQLHPFWQCDAVRQADVPADKIRDLHYPAGCTTISPSSGKSLTVSRIRGAARKGVHDAHDQLSG